MTKTSSLGKDKLTAAARIAWRNATRCIGRLYWKSLHVFDQRHLQTEAAIFEALLEQIRFATNGGNIRPAISIFAKDVKIWNSQLIRYAGYRQADGSILGDPANAEFTAICQHMGWQGSGTAFDLLPIVLQKGNGQPRWFSLPPEAVLEVAITHPDYDFFQTLGLKWYALPSVSDMALEIDGQYYPAAPFSGWYMGTEIGARNFADTDRYDLLPLIAQRMGLDTSSPRTLWKDRALLELNVAVLHSFEQAGVKITDHHTAAELFEHFEKAEAKAGRDVKGDWAWLVPPMSGATTAVFHRQYDSEEESPRFVYRSDSPWKAAACPFAQ